MRKLAKWEGVLREQLDRQDKLKMGEALWHINTEQLYTPEKGGRHLDWGSYCGEVWGWCRRYANELIAAYKKHKEAGTPVPSPLAAKQPPPRPPVIGNHKLDPWEIVAACADAKPQYEEEHPETTKGRYPRNKEHNGTKGRYDPSFVEKLAAETGLSDRQIRKYANITKRYTREHWETLRDAGIAVSNALELLQKPAEVRDSLFTLPQAELSGQVKAVLADRYRRAGKDSPAAPDPSDEVERPRYFWMDNGNYKGNRLPILTVTFSYGLAYAAAELVKYLEVDELLEFIQLLAEQTEVRINGEKEGVTNSTGGGLRNGDRVSPFA